MEDNRCRTDETEQPREYENRDKSRNRADGMKQKQDDEYVENDGSRVDGGYDGGFSIYRQYAKDEQDLSKQSKMRKCYFPSRRTCQPASVMQKPQ